MKLQKIVLGLLLAGFMSSPAAAEVQAGTKYRAAIWVDPDGCQHWVIDTGIEGFMSQRLDRIGKPVCEPAPVQMCEQSLGFAIFGFGGRSCR